MGGSSRPGRIDRVIELGKPNEDARRHIAKRILADCPWTIEVAVSAGIEDSAAQFQERCIRIALADHWEKCGVETDGIEIDGQEGRYGQIASEKYIQAESPKSGEKESITRGHHADAIPA